MTMEIEVQKAKLEKHHYVEHVAVAGTNGNPKLEVTPTDEYARQHLEHKDWSDYTVFVEVV